jgi:anti-sigma factor RsiW
MNATNPPAAEHQDIWELLPWLVNGRLSDADCRRVESHLQVCGACRDECLAQRQIYRVVSADTAVEQMPMAGLNKLRQRIESTERAISADAPPDQASPAPRRATPARSRRPRTAAVAASVLAISAALGIPAALRWNQARHDGSAAYYTVTTPALERPGAVIRAVFAPTATLSELQSVLDDAHLKIVSGPTEAGVYSLAMTGPQATDWSLRRLRGHDTVRFAEALGPASVMALPP